MESPEEKNEILELFENLKPIFIWIQKNNTFLTYGTILFLFSWYLNPIIKESKFPWNKSIEYYLISKEALKKEESSSKKVKKLTNDLELEILVAKTTGTFWRSLDDWIFANSSMIKITGTEAKLLKDSRGIPKTFFPHTFECTRLINLYQRAKEIGFPGDFNFN